MKIPLYGFFSDTVCTHALLMLLPISSLGGPLIHNFKLSSTATLDFWLNMCVHLIVYCKLYTYLMKIPCSYLCSEYIHVITAVFMHVQQHLTTLHELQYQYHRIEACNNELRPLISLNRVGKWSIIVIDWLRLFYIISVISVSHSPLWSF